MRRSFIFVTTELDPITPGGAGAVVARLGEELTAAGHDVRVVLVAEEEPELIEPVFKLHWAAPGEPDRGAPTEFLARSRAAGQALQEIVRAGRPDLIELQDFEGLGYWALAHRAELGLQHVAIAIRLHGPIDLIAAAMEEGHTEWDVIRPMEAGAYRMADLVVVPSPPMAGVVADRYGLDRDRIVIGQPPIPVVPKLERSPSSEPRFLVYGRLGEVKGSIEVVEAATGVHGHGRGLRVDFVGEDGWHPASQRSMRSHLESLVPPADRGTRIKFHGRLDRAEVAELAREARAVIIPSRFESFCLAAHEARAMGAPLIVPDLPAFEHYFSRATGALIYDGTARGLSETMTLLSSDLELTEQLAAAPLPDYDSPIAPYMGEIPAPRHERSQAGLATAAVKEVETALSVPPRESLLRSIATRTLRLLPAPLAKAAVRIVPRMLKDRFRNVASWPEEVERRERRRLLGDFAAQATPEAFPEVIPVISVIIPCYNQGPFLLDAIRSVFGQSFSEWEIIVVNDGSQDPRTVEIIDALHLPRTRVLAQENRGLPAARNAGISIARGQYLIPLDADDELTGDFMAEMHRALETQPRAGFAHCWAQLFGDQNTVFATRPFNPYQQLLSNGVIGAGLIRREAWEAVDGYDETMREGNEDWDLWLRMQKGGWGQVQLQAPLFRYRKHGASMSTSTEARFEDARLEMVKRHPELYKAEVVHELKAASYPAVSVLVDPRASIDLLDGQKITDVEVLAVLKDKKAITEMCHRNGWPLRAFEGDGEAAAGARGKYVIDWAVVAQAGPNLIVDLAEALEREPLAAATGLSGPDGDLYPMLWRRWAPTSADRPEGTLEATTTGELAAGQSPVWPRRLWSDDRAVGPSAAQSPEELAFVPDWLTEADQ